MRTTTKKSLVLGIGIACALGFAAFVGDAADSATKVASDWQPISTINGCNKRHEATFVQAGDKYYLMGGRRIQVVDIYDPHTNTWYRCWHALRAPI